MSTDYRQVRQFVTDLLARQTQPNLVRQLQPKPGRPGAHLPASARISAPAVERRWRQLGGSEQTRRALLDTADERDMQGYERNIENFIGTTTPKGELYAAVTLPNVMVGTVGGGTGLPSQRACLEIMGLAGPDHARALAEVCAGLVLAGELSIAGAMCAQAFARAHQRLARGGRS